VLTETGALLAVRCASTVQTLHDLGVEQIGLNRWTMPILYQLSRGPEKFGEMRKHVCSISPRALTRSLRELVDHDLAARIVAPDMPVVITYSVTGRGERLASSWR
jgi:DNA-binding HxlR family transcriptional regulator